MLVIPGLLYESDRLGKDMKREDVSVAEVARKRDCLCARVTQLDSDLDDWKCRWADTYPGVAEKSERTPSFGIADLPNEESIPIVDKLSAQAMSMYYAAKLLLLRSGVAFARAGPEKTPALVRGICSCAHAQLGIPQDYFGALAMLFPLRVAYFTTVSLLYLLTKSCTDLSETRLDIWSLETRASVHVQSSGESFRQSLA